MRTKTLVKTLKTFRVIPSHHDLAGGDEHEDFGGDLVPEAIVVKNILEGMYHSLDTLVKLRRFVMDEEDMRMLAEADLDEAVRDKLTEFREKLVAFSESDEYLEMKKNKANGSEEAEGSDDVFEDRQSQSEGGKAKEGKKTEKKNRLKSIANARQSPLPTEADFVTTAREILLMAQNDRRTAITLKQLVKDKKGPESEKDEDEALASFMDLLDQVHQSSKERILVPIKTYMQEVQDLCQSIHMHQKFDKVAKKLKANLEEIEVARSKVKEVKMKEKEQLEAAISAIREDSQCRIREHMDLVSSRMRVVSWNSHARRTRTMEHVNDLRRELDEAMDEHTTAETDMRKDNLKLEAEVDEMIRRYDREMFERHHAIQTIREEYAKERKELRQIESKLEVVEAERAILEEENRLADEKKVMEELNRIRRIVACKVIQKMWRAYKARMMLKHKKKRRKHRRKKH